MQVTRCRRGLHAVKYAIALSAAGILMPGRAAAEPDQVSYEVLMNGEKSVCGFFESQGASRESLDQIGLIYINRGFTADESAEIVARSVQTWCNEYLPNLRNSPEASGTARPDWFSDKQWRYVQKNSNVMCHVLTAYPDDRGMFESQVDIAIHDEGFAREEAVYMILQAVKDNCPDLFRHWEQNPMAPGG